MNGPKTGKEASGAFGQDGERSQSRASDVPRSVLFLDPYLLKMSIFSNTTTAHPGVRITILAPGFFPMWPAPSRFQRRLTPERTTYRGISCHPGCLAPESICTVPGCWNRLSLLNVYIYTGPLEYTGPLKYILVVGRPKAGRCQPACPGRPSTRNAPRWNTCDMACNHKCTGAVRLH